MLTEIVGANIRRKRISRGETLEDLGNAAGVDTSHIGKIERGKHNATLDILLRISNALDMQLHELFDEGAREERYETVTRFIKRNMLFSDKLIRYYDPFRVLDMLGRILLKNITVCDVEAGAKIRTWCLLIRTVVEVDGHRKEVYGINCCRENETPITIPDISSDKNFVKNLVAKFNENQASPEDLWYLVNDAVNEAIMI
ncbi:DUF6514 family protein [Agathobaculum sp.]|uniref:DUF6514 family protein n=1 Tax=Agathobaculum sp. TaxID=2048138 RepID=UPI002A82876C|nr:DUF6514 family protein [Agathobaculum sp.]MDY3617728.1 DUF6514 family protein [Agathobaculum sp.]